MPVVHVGDQITSAWPVADLRTYVGCYSEVEDELGKLTGGDKRLLLAL